MSGKGSLRAALSENCDDRSHVSAICLAHPFETAEKHVFLGIRGLSNRAINLFRKYRVRWPYFMKFFRSEHVTRIFIFDLRFLSTNIHITDIRTLFLFSSLLFFSFQKRVRYISFCRSRYWDVWAELLNPIFAWRTSAIDIPPSSRG